MHSPSAEIAGGYSVSINADVDGVPFGFTLAYAAEVTDDAPTSLITRPPTVPDELTTSTASVTKATLDPSALMTGKYPPPSAPPDANVLTHTAGVATLPSVFMYTSGAKFRSSRLKYSSVTKATLVQSLLNRGDDAPLLAITFSSRSVSYETLTTLTVTALADANSSKTPSASASRSITYTSGAPFASETSNSFSVTYATLRPVEQITGS